MAMLDQPWRRSLWTSAQSCTRYTSPPRVGGRPEHRSRTLANPAGCTVFDRREVLSIQAASTDVVVDRRDELAYAAEGAPADALARDLREVALHEVEPRGARGGEVQVESGMLVQPLVDHRVFVRAVVVHDQVQVQALGGLGVEHLQERQEL